MYICPNCKKVFDTPLKFCYECGTQVINVENVVEQQTLHQAGTYSQNPYEQNPYSIAPYYQPKRPSKAKEIVGMALSIEAFATSIIGILYTILFMISAPEAGFVFGLIFSIISLPTSIVGFVMSKGCINAGSTSAMCSIGKKLGLAAIIISAVMLFFAFASIGMIDSY